MAKELEANSDGEILLGDRHIAWFDWDDWDQSNGPGFLHFGGQAKKFPSIEEAIKYLNDTFGPTIH